MDVIYRENGPGVERCALMCKAGPLNDVIEKTVDTDSRSNCGNRTQKSNEGIKNEATKISPTSGSERFYSLK